MKFYLASILFMLAFTHNALARPVSYPGGITLMQTNDMLSSNLHIHYSPSIDYSIGYKGEYWRDDDWQFHGLQLNNLVKRWNKPASQANFYVKSGAGFIKPKDGETELAGFTGLSVDWENRRYFTQYENRYYHAGDIDQFYSQKARLGIAPYMGDYGDLHTWLMLQVDHMPTAEDSLTVTPLVRLFKGEYLTEIGVNNRGEALLNIVIRY